ncbi:MAG: ABC transporter ATP-binding protein [Polyangiaceae bacterium]
MDTQNESTGTGPASNPSEAPPASSPPLHIENGDMDIRNAATVTGKKTKKGVEYAIRLNGVTKRFGQKTAVNAISLKIKAGSVYGLIGPNGAGKTTTFSMMAGFLEPTEGAVEVLGYSPTQVDSLRARLGVLPQDAMLPASDKVGEFLVHMARLQNVPSEKAESEARAVLEEVDGKDWWNLKCGGLSHGMAKRVAIAQALMGSPEVVLLDEPTAGLDPRIAYEVRQLIKSRRGRCTLIISSHNLQELEEVCDAAAILDRGRVVASGSIAELTASSQEIRVRVSPPIAQGNAPHRSAASSVPMSEVEKIPAVTRAEFDEERMELVVHFERGKVDAETIIGQTLWVLLNAQTRISGVSKGRGLEQRVMELT